MCVCVRVRVRACIADVTECEVWEFKCVNGKRCVLKIFTCNGRDDCGDLSDEDEKTCSQLYIYHHTKRLTDMHAVLSVISSFH